MYILSSHFKTLIFFCGTTIKYMSITLKNRTLHYSSDIKSTE